MSLDFIQIFQTKLYDTIKNNHIIKEINPSIFCTIQQDAKQPFVLINILKITNILNITSKHHEIDFQICIFDHQKTQNTLLRIAEAISYIITPDNLQSNGYFVISTNFLMSDIVRGHDLLTTKFIMNYKALIKIE